MLTINELVAIIVLSTINKLVDNIKQGGANIESFFKL